MKHAIPSHHGRLLPALALIAALLLTAACSKNVGDKLEPVLPQDPQLIQYTTAQELLADGQYDEAIGILDALGDYEDAASLALEARYLAAVEMLHKATTQQECAAAKAALEALREERDVTEMLFDADYHSAELLLNAPTSLEDFDTAITMLNELGSYGNAFPLMQEAMVQRELYRYHNTEEKAQAYTALGDLIDFGNEVAIPAYAELGNELFDDAVACYEAKDYLGALALFQIMESPEAYENYDLYRIIAMINTYLDDRFTLEDWEYDILFANLDREDARLAVMCRSDVAKQYLIGNWKSTEGKKTFYMKANSTTNNNMPFTKIYNTYWNIHDGDYIRTVRKDPSTYAVEFHIEVVDYNTMTFTSYHDGSSYTMVRIVK